MDTVLRIASSSKDSDQTHQSPTVFEEMDLIGQLVETLTPDSDSKDTAEDVLVLPSFNISCLELKETSNTAEDYQIDAFLIKLQQRYNTNPVLIRLQLQHLFVNQLKETQIPYDLIAVIESFLPKAPDMNQVQWVATKHSIASETLYSYDVNSAVDGQSILRTSRRKERKYVQYVDHSHGLRLITSEDHRELVYDFGVFSTISAVVVKTPCNLGTQSIRIAVPCHDHSEHSDRGGQWLTHSKLAVASYDGWLGFVGLDILAQTVKLEFDSNNAVITELLFV